MTDDHLLDELASAHLDGTTSPEEAERVEADPALRARVEELRAVREAVRAVPPVDGDRRDLAIAAAVAAFAQDAADRDPQAAGSVASVTPLAAVARRRGPSPSTLRALGVAAAVVLLAALASLLPGDGEDDADTATRSEAFEDADRSRGDDEAENPTAAGSGEDAAPTTSTGPDGSPLQLGRFEDVEELAASVAVRDERSADAGFAVPETLADEGDCPSRRISEASADGAATIQSGTATVAGEDVVVLIVTDSDGSRSLRVFRSGTCSLVERRDLP